MGNLFETRSEDIKVILLDVSRIFVVPLILFLV